MMEMIGVPGERVDPFKYPPEKNEGGVHNRDQQGDDRNEVVNFVGMTLIERQKCDERNEQAQWQASGVSENNFSRWQREKEKPQSASR